MLTVVDKVLSFLFPVMTMRHAYLRDAQFAGGAPTYRQWHRTKQVQWFNGFPGWPKLPLVQHLRASPFGLDPVASSQPDGEEKEEAGEDPEPLCRNCH
jgi:hypothetical protein